VTAVPLGPSGLTRQEICEKAWRRRAELVSQRPPATPEVRLERLARRLWARVWVDHETGCWIWTGTINARGYGVISDGPFPDRRATSYAVHRLAYELLVGPVPDGLVVHHKCEVKRCVKASADEYGPAHTEPTTQGENIRLGGPIAKNRRPTHCPQGHPYDEENTIVRISNGSRMCRQCVRDRSRRRKLLASAPQSGLRRQASNMEEAS
jgi:hypothetical protein